MTATGGSFGDAFYKGAGKPSGSDDLFLGVGIHNDPSDPTEYINIRLTDGSTFYSAGSINLSGGISFSGSNNQGPSGLVSDPWKVILVSGSDVVGTTTHPFWVTGSVFVINPSSGGSGGVITGSVGITSAVAIGNFPSIQTITGSVVLARAVDVATMPSLSVTNVVNVTGSVHLADGSAVTVVNFPATQTVTGSVGITTPVVVSNFPVTQAITGSVSLTQGVTVTGSVSLSQGVAVSNFPATQTITGSVGITAPVAISNFPTTQNVIDLSGSVVGLLYGGAPAGQVNPLWVTGSVFVINQSAGGAASNVNVQSGSVTGLLVGGQPVSNADPVPTSQQGTVTITGSVSLTQGVTVTGSVGITAPVAVSNFPATQTITGSVSLTQGVTVTGSVSLSQGVAISSMPNVTVANFPATQTITGSVSLTQGATITGSVGITSAVAISNFPAVQTITGSISLSQLASITGSVGITAPVAVSNFPAAQTTITTLSGSVAGLLYGGVAAGQANPFWVTGSVFVINQSAGGAASNVTVVSGSVTGLLVGGVPVSNAAPVPTSQQGVVSVTGSIAISQGVAIQNFPATQAITGSVSLTQGVTVTGSVSLSQGVAVSNFPTTQTITGSVSLTQGVTVTGSVSLSQGVAISSLPNVTVANPQTTVTTVSGSLTSLLYANSAAGQVNPFWVTGSVFVLNQGGAGSNVTALSGSVVGLQVGGVPLAGSNPIPVTGSVTLAAVAAITGSVGITAPIAISNFPVAQTTVTTLSGSVAGLLYGGVAAGQANPFWVTGSVFVLNQGGAGSNVTALSGSVVGLQVGGVALSQANPVPVREQGVVTITGSLSLTQGVTVTGSVSLTAAPSILNAYSPLVQATWTSVTAVETTLSISTLGLASVGVSIRPTGTFSGGAAIFETSDDGIGWVTSSLSQQGQGASNSSVTFTAMGGQPIQWVDCVAPATNFRVRLEPAITGAGSVVIHIVASAASHLGQVVVEQLVGSNLQMTSVSGSVAGLLYGGVAAGQINPFWVTGSVSMQPVTIQSGSVTGLFVGGVPLGNINPMPVSGSTNLMVGGTAVDTSHPLPVSGTVALVTLGANVTVTNPLYVSQVQSVKKTYKIGVSGTIAGPTVAGTSASLAYLWNPSTGTLQKEIQKIKVTVAAQNINTTGFMQIRGHFITLEGAAPGGQAFIPISTNRGNGASNTIFRQGATQAPGKVSPDLFTWTVTSNSGTIGETVFEYAVLPGAQGIILRASTAEGFEVMMVGGSAIASPIVASADFEWTET